MRFADNFCTACVRVLPLLVALLEDTRSVVADENDDGDGFSSGQCCISVRLQKHSVYIHVSFHIIRVRFRGHITI